MSSMASASKLFSREFSCSIIFSRLASETASPPKLGFHLDLKTLMRRMGIEALHTCCPAWR
ncbi:hypothetical protein BST63_01260 [Bradyrhizobium canariense]|uniref:Uncharacterized protein n=1 Tax=Bradyrhizobium canariense TaxID=255045 RepID=A0ABX3XBV8_9BRAD|nr:hypothetical protein BSR47_04380 [Bradyrhizobium canariense]OSJ35872.1 hypothetical protein BST63_01260 [Bradyrhizobium canariense]